MPGCVGLFAISKILDKSTLHCIDYEINIFSAQFLKAHNDAACVGTTVCMCMCMYVCMCMLMLCVIYLGWLTKTSGKDYSML